MDLPDDRYLGMGEKNSRKEGLSTHGLASETALLRETVGVINCPPHVL